MPSLVTPDKSSLESQEREGQKDEAGSSKIKRKLNQRKSISSGDRETEVGFGVSSRRELEETQAASCLRAPEGFRDLR